MLRFGLALGAALAFIGSALAQTPEGAAPSRKRVLVYTVSAGFEHDVVKRAKPDEPSLVERALVELGKQRGWFECVLSRDARDFTREKLAAFDLVLFYTTGELPFSEENRRALFDFVKEGKAFAGVHCATDTFYKVPEYGEMVGAYFDDHPWHEKVRVLVDDREHPSTRHLGASFEITDEIYQFKAPYERAKLHVLLHLDPDAVDLKKENVHRKDRDFANAWCKDFGKGHVFYTALGHRPEVWADARFQRHLEGGLAWAMRAEKQAGFDAAPGAPVDAKPPAKAPEKGGGAPAPDERSGSAPNHAPALAAPPGFAVDLVAQSPEILWPSAVACLDDGTLLVGEDRMDMPGPTDQPVDRLIALHFRPDGGFDKTVFAEHLYAVMGVELVDDAVYVMNMPHLTRLRDTNGDGVADERTEVLTDLGPQAPGFPGGFNDHIVSGVRLGLDGFLYISVGDKGIPHAHGTDGRVLTLRGGGVIRVRPDGSRLEIVATGLRNVLDVAIDAQGEMFTYDNTDDGLGWWTRITHIVPGGYYGYPWDYKEHPERMLPCMAEYGGGSPCGGLVYRESAWPAEFHGNLFFCEWGKGSLRRIVLEPQGATFRVAHVDEFVTAGDAQPFKPFDVCESPDGRFLYVSDWAYDGWQADKQAGRIWRVRRAADDVRVASRASPLPRDTPSLVNELGSASFRRRVAAQRALAASGPSVVPLVEPIAASPQDRVDQRHAIWVLAECAQQLWEPGGNAPQFGPEAWRQLARAAEVHPERIAPDARNVATGDGTDAVSRASGLRIFADQKARYVADGREYPAKLATARLGELLATDDVWWNWTLAAMWKRMQWVPAIHSLDEKIPIGALEAVRERYERRVTEWLTEIVRESSYDRKCRAHALEVLGSLARKEPPWDGRWWNIQPAKTPRPRRTVDWEETESILGVVRQQLFALEVELRRAAIEIVRDLDERSMLVELRTAAQRSEDVSLRLIAIDALGTLQDDGAASTLALVIDDARRSGQERQHAVVSACAIRSTQMLGILRRLVGEPTTPDAHAIPAMHALARLDDVESVPMLTERARSGSLDTRRAAIQALARIQRREAGPTIAAQLVDPSPDMRNAACRALAEIADERQVAALLPLANDAQTAAEATLALARTPDVRATGVFLDGVRSKEKRVVDASRLALVALRDDARGELEQLHREGKLDELQLAAVQDALRGARPVIGWKLLGPFARDARPAVGEALDARRPDLGATLSGRGGEKVAWKDQRADARNGFVNLRTIYDGFDDSTAFAFASVSSARARAAELLIGSDDCVAVWLNGALVHELDGDRPWSDGQDKAKVELREGPNQLFVRIDNRGGGWAFNVKISGDATGPLFERAASVPGVDDYRAFALAHPGDAQHGYAIFRLPSGPMCIRCHTVFGEGAQVGPELSDIAAKYGRDEILNSVLTPSQRIAEGYNSVAFELSNGLVVFGQVKRETADAIEIYDTNGELKKLDKSDVESRTTSKTSVMPDGLAALISKEDFSDLVAYLLTLRGAK